MGARGIGSSTLSAYSMVLGQSIRTLVVARILGPADFGILNLVNVGTNLSTYSDLGTGMAGEQEASEARGRDQEHEAPRLLRRTGRARMTTAWALSGILVLVGVTLTLMGREQSGLPVFVVAVAGPLQMLWFCVRGWLRVTGQFQAAMWAQWSQVIIWIVLVPIAAWYGGLLGAMIALALSYLPPVLMSARKVPVASMMAPSVTALKELFGRGLRVWSIAICSFLMVYVDQFLAGLMLGDHALGLYAIGMLTANALVAFSDGAAAAAHPQTLEARARQGALEQYEPSVVRVMRLVELAFSVLVPLSWVGMALVTAVFLTDYRAALGLVALLGATAALVGIPTSSNATLLAEGLHPQVPKMFLVGIGIKIGLSYALVQMSASPTSIAYASLVGTFVYATLYLRLVGRALGYTGRTQLAFAADHLIGAVLLAVGAVTATWALESHGTQGYVVVSLIVAVVCALVQATRRMSPPGRHIRRGSLTRFSSGYRAEPARRHAKATHV